MFRNLFDLGGNNMSNSNPQVGHVLTANLVGADEGDIWTGFEWVKPHRYQELLKEGKVPPPMQPQEAYPDLLPTSRPIPPLVSTYAQRVAEAQQDEIPILELLKHVIGEDPAREGLLETPARAVKAWKEWTSGYGIHPADVLKVFEDGAEGCDEMVVVHDIPIYSHCEHHLAAIFGAATVAYIPDGKIVGLSKLPRLVDIFARRLQVQERLTNQVADAIAKHLQPKGCGVVVKARHMCMESRGIRQPNSYTTTSALRGVFKTDASARAEFLSLTRNGGLK